MAPSEQAPAERMVAWTAGAGIAGGFVGVVRAGFEKPAVGENTIKFVGRHTLVSAGELAGIAAVFSGLESTLELTRGPAAGNSAIAGCAAGSLLGVRAGSITNAAYGCVIIGGLQMLNGMQNKFNGHGGH